MQLLNDNEEYFKKILKSADEELIEEYKNIYKELPKPYNNYLEGELARLILWGENQLIKLEERNGQKKGNK